VIDGFVDQYVADPKKVRYTFGGHITELETAAERVLTHKEILKA